jgi:hypothetical protein
VAISANPGTGATTGSFTNTTIGVGPSYKISYKAVAMPDQNVIRGYFLGASALESGSVLVH